MPCGSGGCGSGSTGGCGVGGGSSSGGGCAAGGCGVGGGASGSEPSIPEIVGVKFPATARTYQFDSNHLRLDLGEHCIVETERGPSYGHVTQPTMPSPAHAGRSAQLKKVLRRATFEDRERFEQAGEQEKQAFEYCRRRIQDRKLEMKLVNVGFSLEDPKATFFFTADGRVDFRALVRDLASYCRVRVEMRQIGVRDAAKMLGGYGDCGRPLCCSTFLRHFEPITIQMAKAQKLSLNPGRISGMCGRLKCCLRYEYVPSSRPHPERGRGRPNPPPAGQTGETATS